MCSFFVNPLSLKLRGNQLLHVDRQTYQMAIVWKSNFSGSKAAGA
jgi:hypothetical protein